MSTLGTTTTNNGNGNGNKKNNKKKQKKASALPTPTPTTLTKAQVTKANNLAKINERIMKQKQQEELQKKREEEMIRAREEEIRLEQEAERKRLEQIELKKKQKKEKSKLAKKNKAETDKEKRNEKIRQDLLGQKTIQTTNIEKVVTEAAPDISHLYKSPICCVLGHVNAGKTSMLDKIRNSQVQKSEASGITQQIGATYCPNNEIARICTNIIDHYNTLIKIPGILLIDTPGHIAFNNLKYRGTSLCDFIIFVIDIMNCTIDHIGESLEIIKEKKIPFVVALNQIDKLNGWIDENNDTFNSIQSTISKQSASTIDHFNHKLNELRLVLSSNGINSDLFYNNPNLKTHVPIVPISAKSNVGICDMFCMLLKLTARLKDKLLVSPDVECNILEVKKKVGLGITLDCILINGVIKRRDKLLLSTTDGPFLTTIKSIQVPSKPLVEIRTNRNFVNSESVRGAMCVSLILKDVSDKFIAGTPIFVVNNKSHDELEKLQDIVQHDVNKIAAMNSVNDSEGVCIVASTLGSVEALRYFLKENNINVFHVSIGISKKTIMAASIMLDKNPLYASILVFDVEVSTDLGTMAKELGINIFTSDTIYKLLDTFMVYVNQYNKTELEQRIKDIVWPCTLRIFPNYIFNKKNPIVVGVTVVDGVLRIGTPICVTNDNGKLLHIGKVTSIENNKVQVTSANAGDDVAVKIDQNNNGGTSYEYGRHFDNNNLLHSCITRESINMMKVHFRKELIEHLELVKELKVILGIV